MPSNRFASSAIREPVLLPHPIMTRRVNEMAADFGAELVVLDPAVPLGLIGPSLDLPYDVVLHGAEVTVPGRLPVSKQGLVLRAEGRSSRDRRRHGTRPPRPSGPPAAHCRRPWCRRVSTSSRFRPLDDAEPAPGPPRLRVCPSTVRSSSVCRGWCRARVSTPRSGRSPRCADTHRDLVLAIAGRGRDHERLRKLAAELDAPVQFLGRVQHDDLPRLYGCADVFTMLCRNRWGGLEQEGFGIVFVEAAACGVPQVAGDSGGAAEAVEDGETGIVIKRPDRQPVSGSRHGRCVHPVARRSAVAAPDVGRLAATCRTRVLVRRAGGPSGRGARDHHVTW